jgi:hypothetical protein
MFTTRRILIVLLVIGIISMLSGIGLLLYSRNQKEPSTAPTANKTPGLISGTFNINGVIPEDATLTVTKRLYGSDEEFQVTDSDISPVDEGTWSIDGLEAGKSYEIVVKVIKNGETISTSASTTVTAPASNTVLTIDLPLANPKDIAALSGTIRVNGYIPENATINIQGRKLGEKTFQTFIKNLPAESRQVLNYATAVKGQTYEIYGTLYDKAKKQVGASDVLVLTAPAINETITINSQAVSTATITPTVPNSSPTPSISQTHATTTPTLTPTPVSLSGSINFNGIAPVNSRIVILQKPYNSTNYQVAQDNITPIDGTTWKWTGAISATWYDVVAILKQRQSNGTDKDIAGSQVIPAAAPASNIDFIINSSVSLSAPAGPITVTCNTLSSSTWSATISLGTVTGAQTYWYQIGTTNGGTETANTVLAPVSGQTAQTVSLSLSKGTSYYVRYAYATIAGVPAGSTQFSPFTGTTQIQCD